MTNKAAPLDIGEDGALAAGWRIEMTCIHDLKPHPENPKDHDHDDIRRSMVRFGYAQPVLIDDRTGYLLAGHGRREVLLMDWALGKTVPQGITVDEDGRWYVPAIRGYQSVDDDEAAGFAVADNMIPALGGWLNDKLAETLQTLQGGDAGLEGTGATEKTLNRVLADLQGRRNVLSEDDAGPALGGMQFQVIVAATSEEHQRELLERFETEGLECRPLTV